MPRPKPDFIVIAHVNPEQQRYPTIGDWLLQMQGKTLEINVSTPGTVPHDFILVAIHELVEAVLCLAHDVSPQAVDEWDKSHLYLDEPGGHPEAPYHREHKFAENIERLLAHELGVDWHKYDESLLWETPTGEAK